MQGAIIHTERLWLREMTPDDAPFAFELNNDPEVIRFTGDDAFASVEAARSFLEAYADYRKFGRGRWAVIRKDDHAFLGWCGLKFHADSGETDIGFRLMRRYWNMGYSTEAAKACLHYGFIHLGLYSIMAQVMEPNQASIRVLEKIGMTRERACLFDDRYPGYRYNISKEEWLRQQ